MKKKVRKVRKDKWIALNTLEEVLAFLRPRYSEVLYRAYNIALPRAEIEYITLSAAVFSTMWCNHRFWRVCIDHQDMALIIGEIYNEV